jgi:predicted ATPase
MGKTSLVASVMAQVPFMSFMSGSFSQLVRPQPYSAVAEAITRRLRSLLLVKERALNKWRTRIGELTAPHAALLLPIVPDLRYFVGVAPTLPSRRRQRRRGDDAGERHGRPLAARDGVRRAAPGARAADAPD